jgi:hypothetical protein
MALLARQDASALAGALITPVSAAGGGDTMVGAQGVHLYVNNGGGAPITVTLVTPEVVEGSLAVTDRTVSVTNGTWKLIPVPSRYNDSTTGLASITYSAVTTVTVAAILCSVQP